MSFLVGGGTAAALALFDLLLSRRYRITWGSVHWWILRILVDAAQGVAAVILVAIAAIKIEGLSDPAVWVLAGMFATRLIQGLQYGSATGKFSFDVKALVERLTVPLEEEIDSTSAAAKAARDRSLAESLLGKDVTPERLAEELISAMQARRALNAKITDVQYLRQASESAAPAEKRMRVLVAKAREIQLLGTVKRLRRMKRPD